MVSKKKSELVQVLQQSGFLNEETIENLKTIKSVSVEKAKLNLQIISLAKQYSALKKKGGGQKDREKMDKLKAQCIELIGNTEKNINPKLEAVKQSLELLEKSKSEGDFDLDPNTYLAEKASLESEEKLLKIKLKDFQNLIEDFESGRIIDPKKEESLGSIVNSPEKYIGGVVRIILSKSFADYMENGVIGVKGKAYMVVSEIINENWRELKGLSRTDQNEKLLALMQHPEYRAAYLENLNLVKNAYETHRDSVVAGIKLAGGILTTKDRVAIARIEETAHSIQSDIDNFDRYLEIMALQTTKGEAFGISLATAEYRNKVHCILEKEREQFEKRAEPFEGLSVSDIKARMGGSGFKIG
ncbi:MAG: hypothetical protein U1E78_08910 [Gammaproteobacteria bacterium]